MATREAGPGGREDIRTARRAALHVPSRDRGPDVGLGLGVGEVGVRVEIEARAA